MKHANDAALEQRPHVLNAVSRCAASGHIGFRVINRIMHKLGFIQPVVSGEVIVVNLRSFADVHPNESTFIPVETRHRLENRHAEPLVIIEVQCGDYLGEDDIVRFDDKYGRTPAQMAPPA